MTRYDVQSIYDFWYSRQESGDAVLTFKGHGSARTKGGKKQAIQPWTSPTKESSEADKSDMEEEPKLRGEKKNDHVVMRTADKKKGKRKAEEATKSGPDPDSPAAASDRHIYLKGLSKYDGYVKALQILRHTVSPFLSV